MKNLGYLKRQFPHLYLCYFGGGTNCTQSFKLDWARIPPASAFDVFLHFLVFIPNFFLYLAICILLNNRKPKISVINKSGNRTIPEFNFNISRATVTAGLIWIYAGYSKQEGTVALKKWYLHAQKLKEFRNV